MTTSDQLDFVTHSQLLSRFVSPHQWPSLQNILSIPLSQFAAIPRCPDLWTSFEKQHPSSSLILFSSCATNFYGIGAVLLSGDSQQLSHITREPTLFRTSHAIVDIVLHPSIPFIAYVLCSSGLTYEFNLLTLSLAPVPNITPCTHEWTTIACNGTFLALGNERFFQLLHISGSVSEYLGATGPLVAKPDFTSLEHKSSPLLTYKNLGSDHSGVTLAKFHPFHIHFLFVCDLDGTTNVFNLAASADNSDMLSIPIGQPIVDRDAYCDFHNMYITSFNNSHVVDRLDFLGPESKLMLMSSEISGDVAFCFFDCVDEEADMSTHTCNIRTILNNALLTQLGCSSDEFFLEFSDDQQSQLQQSSLKPNAWRVARFLRFFWSADWTSHFNSVINPPTTSHTETSELFVSATTACGGLLTAVLTPAPSANGGTTLHVRTLLSVVAPERPNTDPLSDAICIIHPQTNVPCWIVGGNFSLLSLLVPTNYHSYIVQNHTNIASELHTAQQTINNHLQQHRQAKQVIAIGGVDSDMDDNASDSKPKPIRAGKAHHGNSGNSLSSIATSSQQQRQPKNRSKF